MDHEFRIARTELTVEQYLPFVNAFAPHYYGSDVASGMVPRWISPSSPGPDGLRTYSASPLLFRRSVDIRDPAVAMAFVNWLNNDMGGEFKDFVTGAYDLRAFWDDPGNQFLIPQTHDPSADYWIPTLDEMTKASYRDPEKDGGEGGYWFYPHGSDSPPVPGLPGEGEAYLAIGTFGQMPDVGSYPHVQSPWGLLDTAGMNGDMALASGIAPGGVLFGLGGDWGGSTIRAGLDRFTMGGAHGLRLATRVPGPGTGSALGMIALLGTRRRR